MTWDGEFIDGFDKYGPTGYNAGALVTSGEWTSLTTFGFSVSCLVGDSLSGAGQSLSLFFEPSVPGKVNKTLNQNYTRFIGGCTVSSPLIVTEPAFPAVGGITFSDGITPQLSITIERTGQLGIRNGEINGTLAAISLQSIAANTSHVLEWDIVINDTTGSYRLWLDGVPTSISATGQNTSQSGNNYANVLSLGVAGGTVAPFIYFDHLYNRFFLAAGSGDTPLLTNPIVETHFPSADSQKQFTFGAAVLGQAYSAVTTSDQPGANELFLRQFTPSANGTLQSIACIPAGSNGAARFKAVIYSDSGGTPNTLLSAGVEVVGAIAQTALTSALVSPQALTAGTPYWLGFITDTAVSLQVVDANLTGARAVNTYASGAPSPAPAMGYGRASWVIYGNVTGVATNFGEVAVNPPADDLSYVFSATVGNEDLYSFPAILASTQTVYTVAVKALCERSDAGARTVDLRTKSSGSDTGGSAPGQSPAASYGWLSSYWDLDPNGNIPWTPTAVNAATSGMKIAS